MCISLCLVTVLRYLLGESKGSSNLIAISCGPCYKHKVIRHTGTCSLAVKHTRPSSAIRKRANLLISLASCKLYYTTSSIKLTIKPIYSYESTVSAFSGSAIPQVYPPHETLENSPSPVMLPFDSELV